ncbi:MAG: PD40 domain-containing protein [Chloroflexi bacterium]|nr:PD40 domain-containing protein [Chloroflexota bacterium]
MRRLAWLALPVAALVLVSGVPSTASPSPSSSQADAEPSPSPSVSPVASDLPAPSAEPTPEPLLPPPAPWPSPTPAPPPHEGPLKPGDWVQVSGTGSCLNVRMQPGLAGPDPEVVVLNCLPDGFVGRLMDGTAGQPAPVFADGHWWWRILGQGWAAEDWLVFHHAGGFPWPQRPELADAGLIAYLGRDGGIWLMRADGSEARSLVPRPGDNHYFHYLAWSPSGDRLSYTDGSWSAEGGASHLTRIVDLSGQVIAEFPGMAAEWSPDGAALSYLGVFDGIGCMDEGAEPRLRRLDTGQDVVLGPPGCYMQPPHFSPDGSQLAFVCFSYQGQVLQEGQAIEVQYDCAGDGLRLVDSDGANGRLLIPYDDGLGWFSNPSWSPDGLSIALRWTGPRCEGYAVYNVAEERTGACFQLPPPGGFGGRCGSYEDGASDWSPDGRFLIYHWEFGAGRNGVWIADVTTGETTLIPTIPASFVSVASGGGHLAFASAGYIWAVDMDGSKLTLLAEGMQPAWQPRS